MNIILKAAINSKGDNSYHIVVKAHHQQQTNNLTVWTGHWQHKNVKTEVIHRKPSAQNVIK